MLELIKGFVSRVVPAEEIRKSNAEILVIQRAGWGGRKSIVNSYPAASKSKLLLARLCSQLCSQLCCSCSPPFSLSFSLYTALRGSGGDILFLEE